MPTDKLLTTKTTTRQLMGLSKWSVMMAAEQAFGLGVQCYKRLPCCHV